MEAKIGRGVFGERDPFGNAGIEPEMALALWVGVAGFTLAYLLLFFVRLPVETILLYLTSIKHKVP